MITKEIIRMKKSTVFQISLSQAACHDGRVEYNMKSGYCSPKKTAIVLFAKQQYAIFVPCIE
jgi:hypothetical protein